MSKYKCDKFRSLKPCRRCGGDAHAEAEEFPAAKAKCRKCEKVGHYARVCRSIKEEKDQKDSGEANFSNHLCSATLDLVVKGEHKLATAMGNNKVEKTMKSLQHMRFDKKLGKYVAKEGGKAGKLDMRVILDILQFFIF